MLPILSQEEILRYSRHLMIPEVGLEGQKKLKAASVLLVGTGGLGSPIALYLAAAGIGHIGLVDYDRVDSSNLQRQIIHGSKSIGRLKAESARDRMVDLNPFIQVDIFPEPFAAENADWIAEGYDLIIDGTDNFPTRYLINDLCVLTKRPYIYGAIYRFEGQVSVFDARQGPCYRCLFAEPPAPENTPSCSQAGVFGVLPGTIGTLQATEAIKLILGIGETLTGKLLLYDALEMSFQIMRLQKNPRCKICGEHPQITRLTDYQGYCGVGDFGDHKNQEKGDISALELHERLKTGADICLLDVRQPIERQIATLPGALEIPYESLSQRLNELDPQREIVIFCHTTNRSTWAATLLKDTGFKNVKVLRGGINAWAQDIDTSILRY